MNKAKVTRFVHIKGPEQPLAADDITGRRPHLKTLDLEIS